MLAGETSLAETAAILEMSSLFIGNDGGLVHLARALEVPLAAFYGPVPQKFTGLIQGLKMQSPFSSGILPAAPVIINFASKTIVPRLPV